MVTKTSPAVGGTQSTAVLAPNLTPPAGNPRFPLFDSLRAIAALSVFFGHTVTVLYSSTQHPGLFLDAVQLADQGVAIFFLISGFLLYRPFVVARRRGETVALVSYARRRILRIVPAYWVALSAFIAISFVSGVTTHNWWVFYGFGQIYSPTLIGRGLGVAWTLCIEVTFYAALPLLALLVARVDRRLLRADLVLLLLLGAASLAYRAHFHGFFDTQKVSTLPGTFVWFALGMGLAVASVRAQFGMGRDRLGRAVTRWPGAFWMGAGGLTILQYALLHSTESVPEQLLTHVLYGAIALMILLPAVFGERSGGAPRQLLRLAPLQWIGLVSYAFYLYHSIVIAQLDKVVREDGIPARYPVVLIAAFLVTTAVSALSYYLLERPIMRLGGRRARPAGRERPG